MFSYFEPWSQGKMGHGSTLSLAEVQTILPRMFRTWAPCPWHEVQQSGKKQHTGASGHSLRCWQLVETSV
jgi:hypothetical protein